jgi:hypothetical protein
LTACQADDEGAYVSALLTVTHSMSRSPTIIEERMRSKLPAVHPGAFLAEILDEIGVSQAKFARAAGVSAMRVSHSASCSGNHRNIGSICKRPTISRLRETPSGRF